MNKTETAIRKEIKNLKLQQNLYAYENSAYWYFLQGQIDTLKRILTLIEQQKETDNNPLYWSYLDGEIQLINTYLYLLNEKE